MKKVTGCSLVLLVLLSSAAKAQSFGPEQVLSNSTHGVNRVVTADLDGDGDDDILTAEYYNGEINCFENLGQGEFAAALTLPGSWCGGARSLDPVDLDNDGDLDILGAFSCGVGWCENTSTAAGDLSFGVYTHLLDYGITGWCNDAVAIDLNNDSHRDLVYISHDTGNVFAVMNQAVAGTPTFGAPIEVCAPSTFVNPEDVIAADFDGDGDLDVASASAWGDHVSWFENNGTGSAFVQHTVAVSGVANTHRLEAVDMDADTDPDILVSCVGESSVVWFENNGSGVFGGPHVVFEDTLVNDGPSGHCAGDIDGDGDIDVAVAFTQTNRVSCFFNDGSGDYSNEVLVSPDEGLQSVHNAVSLRLSDLDGDGSVELVFGAHGDESEPDSGRLGWFDFLPCGDWANYCIAGANSVSPDGASIRFNGSPSLSNNQMSLTAEDLRPNQFGVFFCGPLRQDPPVSFGDGYRCVGTAFLTRLNPPVHTGTGTAHRALDTNVAPVSGFSSGDTIYFQFWYRDSGTGGAGFNLTDGLEVTFCQ